MPQFSPGEAKTAIAPITVSPSGLSCEAELFLGPDELTKVATSGRRPFSSTGASQSVRLPITMPSAEGTYHAYIDVYAGGLLIAAYQAIEDVVIAAPVTPILAGTILDFKWRLAGEGTWHSWPMVAPANTVVEIKWTVRNDSNCDATFVAGTNINPPFPNIYKDTVTFIEQGKQGDLITSMIPYYKPTSGQVPFEVGALAGLIISTSPADWQYAQVVDKITVTFTLY